MSWNPILIVCLCPTRHSRSISPNHWYLIRRINLLTPPAGLLSPLSALTLLLGEIRGNPDVVEKVHNSCETRRDDKVEEDDLRVENRGVRLHDADSTVESLHCEIVTLRICHNGREIKPQVLWMELRRKAVNDALLLTRGDLGAQPHGREVAHDPRALGIIVKAPETAANEGDSDRFRFIIRDREVRFGWLAVDDFDAKDLRGGEGGVDVDVEAGGFGWIFNTFGCCFGILERYRQWQITIAQRYIPAPVRGRLLRLMVAKPQLDV